MSYRIDQSLVPFSIGWDESGQQVPMVDPDFGESESETGTPIEAAADLLMRLMGLIIPKDGPLRLDLIGQKFLGVYFLLNRNGTETLTSLASRAGVSKQLLDHHTHKMADQIGYHGFGQKRQSTRATYAEVQRQVWSRLTPEERKKRRAGRAAQSTTGGAQFDTEPMVSCKNSPHSQNSADKQESLPIGSPAP